MCMGSLWLRRILASGNLPAQTKEGDGNCFYKAIALWRDKMSDEHDEIHRISSRLIEKNLMVFSPSVSR